MPRQNQKWGHPIGKSAKAKQTSIKPIGKGVEYRFVGINSEGTKTEIKFRVHPIVGKRWNEAIYYWCKQSLKFDPMKYHLRWIGGSKNAIPELKLPK